MAFVARVLLPGLYLPTRGYIHEAGLKDTFDTAEAAKDYLRQTILDNNNVLLPKDESYAFLIAALWGYQGKKVAEINRYMGSEWPGNPDRRCFVFENGIWQLKPDSDSCSETDIVLGLEQQYRLSTPDLETYMIVPPNLGKWEPAVSL